VIEKATLAQLDTIFGVRGNNEVARGSSAVVAEEPMWGQS